MARFEEGVVRFGKDFTRIHKFIGRRKPVPALVLFYYVRWKKGPNYKVWQVCGPRGEPGAPAAVPAL